MPLAYSYLRFSTVEQAKGDSIRRQTEATAAWCNRNKITLDTSISLRDEGVSAYRGKHRENADTHALAALLQAVKSGRIPAGSYLVVESLDRLSREKIRPALTLILNLIESGIKIVQLIPVEVIYDENVDPMTIMMAVMELNRGHSESKVKSERISAVWSKKQNEAGAKKISTKLPCWLKMDGTSIVINPVAGAVLKRIVAMSHHAGITAIAKTLSAEAVPILGRKTIRGRAIKWSAPTVYTLLTSRALVGEYVPYTSTGRGRKPKGKPVAGYFPALITENEFQAVQAALKTRSRIGRGRLGKHVNLLAGLLREAGTDRSLTYRHPTGRKPVIVPVGTGNKWVSFPADVLESAILVQLTEVTSADVQGNENDVSNRVADLSSELSGVESLIDSWTAKMDDPIIIDRVAAKLSELEGQRRKLTEDLATAQREAASPVAEALGNLKSLAHLLDKDKSDETRTKVRAALRRVVTQIRCAFGHRGRVSVACVRVEFVTNKAREYTIIYKMGTLFVDSVAMASTQAAAIDFDELKRRYKEHFAI